MQDITVAGALEVSQASVDDGANAIALLEMADLPKSKNASYYFKRWFSVWDMLGIKPINIPVLLEVRDTKTGKWVEKEVNVKGFDLLFGVFQSRHNFFRTKLLLHWFLMFWFEQIREAKWCRMM